VTAKEPLALRSITEARVTSNRQSFALFVIFLVDTSSPVPYFQSNDLSWGYLSIKPNASRKSFQTIWYAYVQSTCFANI